MITGFLCTCSFLPLDVALFKETGELKLQVEPFIHSSAVDAIARRHMGIEPYYTFYSVCEVRKTKVSLCVF